MRGLVEGPYMAVLGAGTVLFGLVLLVILSRRMKHIPGLRKASKAPGEPGKQAAVAPHLDLDGETVAAIAACLTCIADGQARDRTRGASLEADLVAAVLAAIAAHEESARTRPADGRPGARVQKGAFA